MREYRGGIFKLLWSPEIDSKESIPPAYVDWRTGMITLFLLGSWPQFQHRQLFLANLAVEGGGGGEITRFEGVEQVVKRLGVLVHPHPQQVGPKIPSLPNVRKKAAMPVQSTYSLVSGCDIVRWREGIELFTMLSSLSIAWSPIVP